MDIFSYNEVLDYLEIFFDREIKDPGYLQRMKKLLEGCRSNRTVSIRAIDQCYTEYRKIYHDYTTPTKEEKEVWRDLLNIWQ